MNANEKRNYRSILKRRFEDTALKEIIIINKEKGEKASMKIMRMAAKIAKKDLNKMNLSDLEDYVNYMEDRYFRLYVKQA